MSTLTKTYPYTPARTPSQLTLDGTNNCAGQAISSLFITSNKVITADLAVCVHESGTMFNKSSSTAFGLSQWSLDAASKPFNPAYGA